jgi:adenylate cyclase
MAALPSAAPVTAQQAHDKQLTREILKSERRRVQALAIVVAILLAASTAFVLAPVHPGLPDLTIKTPLLVYTPFLVYELVVMRVIERRLASGGDVPHFARYIGAFVETSLPTVVLWEQIRFLGPGVALGMFAPLLYFLFIILSTLRLDFRLSLFTGAVAAVQLFAVGMLYGALPVVVADERLVVIYHLTRSIVLFIGGVIAGWVGARLRHQFEATIAATSAHERITNLFGQHVSPQVVDRLLETGAEALSETRKVAVMFVDIRGFTAAARLRSPAEVVARLDAAFAVLVEVVDRHGGLVNKFLGDGFLALFGVPLADEQATSRALACGREMLEAIDRHNADHPDWPIRIGISLHVGNAVTGTVGSPRRKEYTVIGDTVNLASRIESLNKEFGSQFLISEAAHVDSNGAAAGATPLGAVPIRGYDTPVPLWRLA